MKNNKYQKGFGIIVIIVIIGALFGAGAMVYYIQSNESTIRPIVEQSRQERAESAQQNGYPSVWDTDDLPKYPNGELKKVRDEMGQATIWTNDSPAIVKSYFDTEMTNRGFTSSREVVNDLVVFKTYKKGPANFTLQATVLKDEEVTKVLMMYNK